MDKSRLKRCPCCGRMKILEEVAVEDYPFYDEALLKRKRKVGLVSRSGLETRRAFKKRRLADKKALKEKRRLERERQRL